MVRDYFVYVPLFCEFYWFFSLELFLLYVAAVVGVQHREDLLHIVGRLGPQSQHLKELLMIKRVGDCSNRADTKSH